MFVAFLLMALVLYLVVRLAVRHGIEDARPHRSDRLRADTYGAESAPASALSASWHWILGAFGWLQ
jgi:hypothetical protein